MDPNVLVSAAISEAGPPEKLLRRWEAGEFELVVSAGVLFEVLEVLKLPKFRRYLSEVEAVAYALLLHDEAEEVSEELPPDVVRGVTGDPDDDYLTGVAFLGKAGVIVSGDRHLLDLGMIRDGEGNPASPGDDPARVPGRVGEVRVRRGPKFGAIPENPEEIHITTRQ